MTTDLPFGLRVEKLTNPVEQVGLPASMKWAVMSSEGFQDAFRTKREAEALKEELLTRSRDALAKKLIDEVVAEEKVRDLTKELLREHNRRCRACPTCVELKALLDL